MPSDVTVEPTTDEPYIKSVFLNPEIYAEMKDDSCPESPTMLSAVDIKAIPGFFLRVLVGGEPGGVFWLLWKGDSVEAHTALMKNCRGRKAIQAVKAAVAWVFSHTEASKITSYAWSDAPAVKWFCRAVGMAEKQTEPWRSTRGGKPVDITYYEITREAA